jgi:hypothetical protein
VERSTDNNETYPASITSTRDTKDPPRTADTTRSFFLKKIYKSATTICKHLFHSPRRGLLVSPGLTTIGVNERNTDMFPPYIASPTVALNQQSTTSNPKPSAHLLVKNFDVIDGQWHYDDAE